MLTVLILRCAIWEVHENKKSLKKIYQDSAQCSQTRMNYLSEMPIGLEAQRLRCLADMHISPLHVSSVTTLRQH
nr:MAG TPA: hypothetical protein [Caudoviricetes sp.]